MTLTEMLPQLSSMTDADAKVYAMVFGAEPYEALQAVQRARPNVQHRAAPVQLTNGQWVLCADLLLETGPGGLYAATFSPSKACAMSPPATSSSSRASQAPPNPV
jgi:hypothetical protein